MAASIKKLLATRNLVKVFGLGQLFSPKSFQIVPINGGFDGIWLDHEHSGISTEQIEQATLAARACGLDSFVRLAPMDYATVIRPLEAGAGGVMVAQVRNAPQTEQIVRWLKFHPRG